MKTSRWIHFKIFRQKFFDVNINEENRLWLPFLTQYFDNPDDLGKINHRTALTLKTSLLEFAVENGHFHLAKVLCNLEIGCYNKIRSNHTQAKKFLNGK